MATRYHPYNPVHPCISKNEPYANAENQRKVINQNRQRALKTNWLRDNNGYVPDNILICTKTSIDTVKDIDDAFFPVIINKKKDTLTNKERWFDLLRNQADEQKLTWRKLGRIQLVDYANKYTLHTKTSAYIGELTNTGLMGLRSGLKLFALPPLHDHVTLNVCHTFTLYNNEISFAHPMLIDEIEITSLLDDCLAAKRWLIIINVLNIIYNSYARQSVRDFQKNKLIAFFPKQWAYIKKFLNKTEENDEDIEIEKDDIIKIIEDIENKQPDCNYSSLFSWMHDFDLSLKNKEMLYGYLTLIKPIGVILSHPHPYNLSQTTQKIDVGKPFRLQYFS